MKKIFTAIATVIVTSFIMKVVDRIKHPEELRKEYEEAERYRKKLEADRRRRYDSARMGKVMEEPLRPFSPDQMDAMALRPRMDMATASNFEPAIGSCAR